MFCLCLARPLHTKQQVSGGTVWRAVLNVLLLCDLQVVGRAGVGIDNVDLQAATEVGCLVVNAPTANTVAAAEHGIALLTALARNVAPASASMKAGKLPLVFQGSHISSIYLDISQALIGISYRISINITYSSFSR